MRLVTDNLQLPLSDELRGIIQSIIADRAYGCVITFRDPDYSAEVGGFHPVEICIDQSGRILYITDFAYFGRPPYFELGKELDFDFYLGLFQQNTGFYSSEASISEARHIFQLWSKNFISYYNMGVYEVMIEDV